VILVFDMDDTLYPELNYVHSGFRAVAHWVEENWGLAAPTFYKLCVEAERKKRTEVFNRVLQQLHYFSSRRLNHCIAIYRRHAPDIELTPEATACFDRFKHTPLYVVTDGNQFVQHKKAEALGLYQRVKKVYLTSRYRHPKPSPYCFEHIAARENKHPNNIVYIADNPKKDFKGIRPLGYQTIRVKTGHFATTTVKPAYDAKISIASLSELTPHLLQGLRHDGS
jgi:putative hydrolase of the HAD superfamily